MLWLASDSHSPSNAAGTAGVVFLILGDETSRMPSVELEEETIERLDALRVDDESYDELVTELINIYETSEYTLFHAGD
jgi:hypothetical protein